MENPTRSILTNVFGTIGTVLWCIQLLPQVWLNHKRQTTEGLSVWLYTGWTASGLTLAIYQISSKVSIPLQIQPFAYGTLCFIIYIQRLRYDSKWPITYCFGLFSLYCILGGGFVAGMVFACESLQNRGIEGLTIFFGSCSDFFLCVGFIPQIYLIWQHREVIGLSYAFLAMDSGGAIFSILSLVLDPSGNINPTALAGYVAILVLEIIVLLLAAALNPAAKRRKLVLQSGEEKGLETTVDETETGRSDTIESKLAESENEIGKDIEKVSVVRE